MPHLVVYHVASGCHLDEYDVQNVRRDMDSAGAVVCDAASIAARELHEGNWQRSLTMIRKLASGEYRLYSRKKNPGTGKRRNLGTFKTRAAAEKHEREVQYFKRH